MSRLERGVLLVALATIAGLLLVALLAVQTDSRQVPAWSVPPSAIVAITTPRAGAQAATSAEGARRTTVPVPSPSLRLPRGSGAEADQSPAATHAGPAVVTRPPTARPAASHSLAELVATGIASNMGPGFGPTYLALPQGRGWIARICGPAACITRVSTDVGPEAWTHRVADLNVTDFERVCGCSWRMGLTTVTVVLEGRK